MKFANSTFEYEEVFFILAIAAFFSMVFFGAFDFNREAGLFPIMISAPALLLLLVYIFRGLLPARVGQAISSNDRFAIGKRESADNNGVNQQEGANTDKAAFDLRIYYVFGFTTGFTLAAYLFGFYAAVCLLVGVYMLSSRKEISYGSVGGLLLIVGLMAVIYLFDTAFGYHFEEGILLSIP